ncbi:polyphosphate:nucleotide phosphotransferase, PPK2 family [Chryseolinea serpens]|uniref:Polyphosphate:nucleotide phosphotransferase, PPK2 family n=2 Tax=Chryseolinea serpens TaxID=947013 RepID=A0A1M5VIN3_9BACT|nr:polyphosphate:nucleotide phosphotransferase, PPK2 family [Chryseolinea serpens]
MHKAMGVKVSGRFGRVGYSLLPYVMDIKQFKVKSGNEVNLKNYPTGYDGNELNKERAAVLLEDSRKQLAEVQDKLYAQNQYSVLIILQAMDAAGKDSAVKHIMSGFNPLGVQVHSFKTPTKTELDHNYLWRHNLALPPRGEIAIHNRSHYENVLVTRVHPEYILNENIPGIDSVDKIKKSFWEDRLEQITAFEKGLAENGTVILKFFLHLSKKEQKKRFLERIDDPSKNWKFEMGDIRERGYWDDYQRYYEEAIGATSKKYAPWFIIPADDKWYTRLAIATIIHDYFEDLSIHYPTLTDTEKADLQKARAQLVNEA